MLLPWALLLGLAGGEGPVPHTAPPPDRSAPAVVLDRIAAVVGDEILLESDLDRLTAVEVVARTKGEEDRAYRERVLEQRIVDLLRERELRKTGGFEPDPREVKARLDSLAQRWSNERGEAFQKVLERARVSEEEVTEWIRRGLALETYTRERLLPLVRLTDADLQAFYEGPFRSEAAARGLPVLPSFAEVQDQVRELLRERRLNEEIASWTEELRARTLVLIYRRDAPPLPAGSSAGASVNR